MDKDNKNDVMGAVMHLQRAMRRGNAAKFAGKRGQMGPNHGPEGHAHHGHGPMKGPGCKMQGAAMKGCAHGPMNGPAMKGCNHGPMNGPAMKDCPKSGMHPGMGHQGHHKPNFATGRLISVLNKAGSMTTGELAEALDLRPSSLSELLGKLEKKDLILRTQDENDKRVYRISLTDNAKLLEEKIAAERDAHMAVYSACFTEEEAATFCALCEKLSKHLEALAAVK